MAKTLANPLGDVRAEADHEMLNRAFYETPDYLSLLESDEKVIVVGRRGTGKSALTYRLGKEWGKAKHNLVIKIAPDEHETLALAPLIRKTGSKFLGVRAVARLLWRYGVLMEMVDRLSTRYKAKELYEASRSLKAHHIAWGTGQGKTFYQKLRVLVRRLTDSHPGDDELIGFVADELDVSSIEKEIRPLLEASGKAFFIVDRLDEGFDVNDLNVAFIDGAMNAVVDIAARFRGLIRPVLFLRDNIYRAVAHFDQDYTRNIEGQSLRLHWDVDNLFYLVCSRLRAAFGDIQDNKRVENNKRLWNRYTSHELQGEDGFRICLRFTLYRPRDILILLNSALENFSKRNLHASVAQISLQDIEKSARSISQNRLDDLAKEYRQIFPSIGYALSAFSDGVPELPLVEAQDRLRELIELPPEEDAAQIELAILVRPEELVLALYSVGFFGVFDSASGTFAFSHDGKRPDFELPAAARLLIHPCYWMALNLSPSATAIGAADATQINDEYEIKVQSATPQIRSAKLNRLIGEVAQIRAGDDASHDFELWCMEAVKIAFAGKLDNVALHPNGASTNRRDIVGRNLEKTEVWKALRNDYGVRQVIFEVKNYAELTQQDYRQMLSYLSGSYGRLGFIICRARDHNLERDRELDWFKSIYSDHKKLIVKLSDKFLTDILGKIRNPGKINASEQALTALLDQYERVYVSQQSSGLTKKKRRSRGATV